MRSVLVCLSSRHRLSGGFLRKLPAPLIGSLFLLGAAPPKDEVELLGAYAKLPGLEARFAEEKKISLLAKPLVKTGKLYFDPPGRLAMHDDPPKTSMVVISSDAVRYKDARGQGSIPLDARPAIRTLVESFMRVLSGDVEGLRRAYQVQFHPGDPWRMELVPKDKELASFVKKLTLAGTGYELAEIHVHHVNGDETITRISGADPRRKFSAEEKKRLFEVGVP